MSGRDFVAMKVDDDGKGFDVGRKLSAAHRGTTIEVHLPLHDSEKS